MKILRNPWSDMPGYNCFGCAEKNQSGLKMKFAEDGEFVVCEWEPSLDYQGFHNILHGGIQATLMDEIASWTVMLKTGKAAVTYNLELKYKRPVLVNNGKIRLKAVLIRSSGRTAHVHVDLFNSDDLVCSEAIADFYIIPGGKLSEEIRFPGKEAFYK